MRLLGFAKSGPFGRLFDEVSSLTWKPAGDPGTFAMIEHRDFPAPFRDAADAIITQFARSDRRLGMVCVSKMVPGQYIPQHADRHDNHCDVRLHLPIVTNPSVAFVSDTKAAHMKAGEVWEFDPTKLHCVANAGDTDRIHLFWNLRLP